MICKETIEVSDDNILMSSVMDKYNITVQQLSNWTGRACSTIYKYLSGDATIVMIIWRVLYRETKDPRILKLITGDTPVVVVDLPKPTGLTPGIPDLRRFMEMKQDQLASEHNIVDILADGKIDSNDRKVIEDYRNNIIHQLRSEYQVFLAIDRLFKKATNNA